MVWDLKPLDSMKAIERFPDNPTDTSKEPFGKHYLAIKLCEREFESTELKSYTADGTKYENTHKSSIENAGNAYWVTYE